jgi:hypothetical protein
MSTIALFKTMTGNNDYTSIRQRRFSAVDPAVWAAITDLAEADEPRFAHCDGWSAAQACTTDAKLAYNPGLHEFFFARG